MYKCASNKQFCMSFLCDLTVYDDCVCLNITSYQSFYLVSYNADARKGMEFQYFSGDCTDPAVQKEAKETFLKAFDKFLQDQYPDFCTIEQTCTLENVQILCGEKSDQNGRKRGIAGVCKT